MDGRRARMNRTAKTASPAWTRGSPAASTSSTRGSPAGCDALESRDARGVREDGRVGMAHIVTLLERLTTDARHAGSWPGDLARPARPRARPRRVAVPGSKSVTNRALLLAALSGGPATVSGAPADPRHRADGRRPARPRRARSGRRRARRRRARTTACAAAAPSTAGSPAPSCGSCRPPPRSPTARSRFDGDPRARERPMGTVLDALRALGARVDGDAPAVHPARHRRAARRRRGDRRVGVVAVRVRPAAVGARYDKGVTVHHDGKPVPSLPHIDMSVAMLRDGRRRRRRRRARTPGGSRPAPIAGAATGPSSPTCPTPRSSSPRPPSPAGGSPSRAGPRRRPSPAPRSCRCWRGAGATVEPGAGRDDRHRARRRCPAWTSTCTTSAS